MRIIISTPGIIMPRRKKVPFRRRRRTRRSGPRVTKLLKDKTVAKLRYVDTISIDAGSASIASHVFRANGADDPDLTSTGHQPLMWDEYTPLYGQYRVLSSTIKITPVATAAANTTPALYGVYRDADTVLGYSKGTSIIEDQRNKGSWGLSGLVDRPADAQGASKRTTFNLKRDTGAETQMETTSTATTPTSPHEFYYQVWCSSVHGNNPGLTVFVVQIDYIVEFTHPKHVTES